MQNSLYKFNHKWLLNPFYFHIPHSFEPLWNSCKQKNINRNIAQWAGAQQKYFFAADCGEWETVIC